MEMQEKVFSSNITRDHKLVQNNLYELTAVIPATPTTYKHVREHTCDFQPSTGKMYVPKKRSRFTKVRTVRDIRNLFESDINADLTKDLEKQHNLLLKKITCGSFRDENTKTIARNILKCDKPISRPAWQMLMNLNPERHSHAVQYVLWNGRRIRVNGSKGGKTNFLCKYDLANASIHLKKDAKRKALTYNKGLLRNSLTIKFRPGPLSKKKNLDDSYQKYNVGKADLIDLPKPGLVIQPSYGVQLEPMITNFVHSLRDKNGTISEKWAEFAVSVLGSVNRSEAIQFNEDSNVTFELHYCRKKQRMLMREDIDKKSASLINLHKTTVYCRKEGEISLESEVEIILKEMLTSIEISLQQDNMYTGQDEPRENIYKEMKKSSFAPKDKNKRRYCELDRLDVTVIRLPENDVSGACSNAHCSLGCICASIQHPYKLRQHCGRLECMFDCKCDFSRYKNTRFDNNSSDLLPGLLNFDNQLSVNMAKEEQKFHQTVVLTGEKSILLKQEKRNWKATKRYSDYYESLCLKNEIRADMMLSIVDIKLNCENVEPWCMVHNLYKCFCKGKFTEKPIIKVTDIDTHETVAHKEESVYIKNIPDVNDRKRQHSQRNSAERNANNNVEFIESVEREMDVSTLNWDDGTCARTKPYRGRKYYDSYYINTNRKILEMEKNDEKLRTRMIDILKKIEESAISTKTSNNETIKQSKKGSFQDQDIIESNDDNTSSENVNTTTQIDNKPKTDSQAALSLSSITSDRSILNASSYNTKLRAWLESSYKQYNKRIEQGIVKKSLDPPKHGKVALYPWEFILSRYRERKNLFMISKQKPLRIFMAVDARHSFFNNCINIDDIRFADLHKYPVTIKNLLTNATDLKDNFCILCGLSHCWELIGSVTKMNDHANNTDQLQTVADDRTIGFSTRCEEQYHNTYMPAETQTQNSPSSTTSENNDDATHQPKDAIRRNKKSKRRTILKRRTKNCISTNTVDEVHSKRTLNIDFAEKPENMGILSTQDINGPKSVSESPIITLENMHLAKDIQSAKEIILLTSDSLQNTKELLVQELPENQNEAESNMQSSKWFVMTVENDFSEIQFYQRGFFVKYESIINAINVARLSGKTVRLSSQKGGDQNNGPQFGIYAIPNSNDYYVFIGPYDKDEPLGIETVKSFADIRKTNRTRGVWITTNKVDNVKVIDNPLSFMPDSMQGSKVVSLDNETIATTSTPEKEKLNSNPITEKVTDSESCPKKQSVKAITPIKICKTNGFYHLSPQGFLRHVLPKSRDGTQTTTSSTTANSGSKSLLQPIVIKNRNQGFTTKMPLLQLPLSSLCGPQPTPNSHSLLKKMLVKESNQLTSTKPVAEIAPQIKIVDVYSESASLDCNKTESNSQNPCKKSERSMFILKPEEINKRLMQNRLAAKSETPATTVNEVSKADLDQDIENFLATSSVYVPPNADIFEISDEDDDEDSENNWKNVWIECETAELGYIRGKKNALNMISFEFPGFKLTDFYPEEDALSKINQVLSRKIYVPKTINLKWRVVDYESDLKRKYELSAECLGPDFVLTKRGVRHKQDLIVNSKNIILKNEEREIQNAVDATLPFHSGMSTCEVDKAIDMVSEQDERSKILE